MHAWHNQYIAEHPMTPNVQLGTTSPSIDLLCVLAPLTPNLHSIQLLSPPSSNCVCPWVTHHSP